LPGPAHQQLEPAQQLSEPVLQPVGGTPGLVRTSRIGAIVVPVAVTTMRPGVRAVTGFVSQIDRLVGGFLCLIGLPLCLVGPPLSLLGGSPRLVGPPLRLSLLLFVSPAPGHIGGFLG